MKQQKTERLNEHELKETSGGQMGGSMSGTGTGMGSGTTDMGPDWKFGNVFDETSGDQGGSTDSGQWSDSSSMGSER